MIGGGGGLLSKSDYTPLDYPRQPSSIGLLTQSSPSKSSPRKSKRHVQPPAGTARAFGQAVRELRMLKGVSQERLALDAGFDRTYVSMIERGISSPTVRAVWRLGDVLSVRPSEMMQRAERILGLDTKR